MLVLSTSTSSLHRHVRIAPLTFLIGLILLIFFTYLRALQIRFYPGHPQFVVHRRALLPTQQALDTL